ncbi:MAG: hypothetical protein P8Z36_13030 [Gemmatimonadota bacterium]
MHNLPAVFTVLGLCLSALSLPFALRWIPPNHALVGIALVVLALNAGCAPGGGGNAGWTTTEDTLPNGVLRVINTPPASGAPVTLEADEELRIGGGDLGGPASFGRIRQIAPLPDGRLAVLDGIGQEIRVFDAGGAHEGTFGGTGGGPGEMRDAQGLLLGPDGLLHVPDKRNARLSYFDPDSGFVRSRRFRVYTTRIRGPWIAAVDSTGRTVVWSSGPYRGGSWLMVRVYDQDMVQVDSIPYLDYTGLGARRLQEQGVWWLTTPNGMRGTLPIPFYAGEQFVLDPTGQLWTTEAGASTLKVSRWWPAGDTTLVLESRRRPRPVPDAERDSVIAGIRSRFSSWPTPPRLDFGEIPRNEPPTYGLSLDDRGRLWVRLSSAGADTTAYDVFDPDGRHAETVVVHARVDSDIPPSLRGDTLWAVVRDELDVQYVIKARLKRPPTAADLDSSTARIRRSGTSAPAPASA